ncbi:hypothetical protein bcere0019_23770 [Bacillus cereus Rock3-28]|nr:hypothetical protein bcere0019_23770 [Bacillus cereus Rock3-28]
MSNTLSSFIHIILLRITKGGGKRMDEHIQPQLSPPWITYFNELKNSVGADPTVTVGPLIPTDGNFIILVQTTDFEKAIALATLLKPTVQFGNVTIIVSVIGDGIVNPIPCPLDAFELAQVVVQPQFPGGANVVFPVFSAEVIQFFNDDISNLCQTFTEVAAQVFRDVMNDAICGIPILYLTSCSTSTETT